MRSLKRIREKIDAMIKEGGADQAVLTFLFSNIRIVLEKERSKKNYPYLSMVCNWYQHDEITRSTIGYNIIQKIGDLIFEDLSKENNGDNQRYDKLVTNISVALNLSMLREEITNFFTKHNISPILTDNNNWNRIMIGILYDLSERPLLLPEFPDQPNRKLTSYQKKGRKVYENLEKKAKKLRPHDWELILPIGVSIEIRDEKFFWRIKMKSMIVITGALINK